MADLVRPLQQSKSQPEGRAQSKLFNWSRLLTYAVLILGAILAIGPFLWMLSASMMTAGEIGAGFLLPRQPMIGNYGAAWQAANLSQFMWNSVRITGITIIGELLFCVPAAYAF